jgi:hypothetical protein
VTGCSRYGNKSDANMNLSAIVLVHEDIRWGASTPVAGRSLTQKFPNSLVSISQSTHQRSATEYLDSHQSIGQAAIKNPQMFRCLRESLRWMGHEDDFSS